jgi:hypothetical protein
VFAPDGRQTLERRMRIQRVRVAGREMGLGKAGLGKQFPCPPCGSHPNRGNLYDLWICVLDRLLACRCFIKLHTWFTLIIIVIPCFSHEAQVCHTVVGVLLRTTSRSWHGRGLAKRLRSFYYIPSRESRHYLVIVRVLAVRPTLGLIDALAFV